MQCAEIHLSSHGCRNPIRIVFLGDVHIGNRNTDEGLVEQVARRLEEDGTYWVDLGDACDFINLHDPRFDPRQLPDWIGVADLADLPSAQVRRYTEIFRPVAGRCLARLSGNHEDAILLRQERDVYREINEALGLPPERALGYSGFVRLRLSRGKARTKTDWTLTLFLHHGAGGGQLAGAKALRLERLPMAFDADIFAMGHTHTKMVLQKRRVGMSAGNPPRLEDRPLILISVGAFMRGELSGYAERRGLYPQGIGPVELWIWPERKQIRVVQ